MNKQPLTKQFLAKLLAAFDHQSFRSKDAEEKSGEKYTIVVFDPTTREQVFKEFTENEVKKAVYRLKDGGYILPSKEQSGETIFKLTPKALDFAQNKIKTKVGKQKWDGQWRLVIFDIPEEARDLRDHLRYALKKLGFKRLQNSVWIHSYDVFDELIELVPDIAEHEWIKLLETKQLIGKTDESLRRKFGL